MQVEKLNLNLKLPNLIQSLLVALVVAAIGYFGTGQEYAWASFVAALVAGATNWYTTHRAELQQLQPAFLPIADALIPGAGAAQSVAAEEGVFMAGAGAGSFLPGNIDHAGQPSTGPVDNLTGGALDPAVLLPAARELGNQRLIDFLEASIRAGVKFSS